MRRECARDTEEGEKGEGGGRVVAGRDRVGWWRWWPFGVDSLNGMIDAVREWVVGLGSGERWLDGARW